MANATLTVNEFRGMTLPTDNPYSPWPLIYTIFLILLVMSLVSFLTLSLMYYFFSRKAKKAGLQNLDKMTVRKKVLLFEDIFKFNQFLGCYYKKAAKRR